MTRPECCEQGLFLSADRTWRCLGCHLNPDACNCSPEKHLRLLTVLGLIDPDITEHRQE